MSVDLSGEITAIAITVLALFAFITAYYARKAFLKQSKELSDQASMLEVQSEQRKVNAEQIRVRGLQAAELRESLAERKREADERRRAQAARVFIWQEYREGNPAQYEAPPDYIALLGPLPHGESRPLMVAHVKNTSDQPVYDLMVRWTLGAAFHSESRRLKPLMPDEENIQRCSCDPTRITAYSVPSRSSATPHECTGPYVQTAHPTRKHLPGTARNPRPYSP